MSNSKKDEAITVKIVPDNVHKLGRVYANFFGISHTPNDFTIDCCDIEPIYEWEMNKIRETGVKSAIVKARIAVPHFLIPKLLAALQKNYDEFKATQEMEKREKSEKGEA